MKKRILSLLLALLMLFGMLPVSSFADDFVPEPPECNADCNTDSVRAHQDQCAVKEYYREIYRRYSAKELYGMKDVLGEDAWAFIVDISWNLDGAKAQELNTLVQNGETTDPSEPEDSCACCENCTGAEDCQCQCGACDFCQPEEPEIPSVTHPETGVEVSAESFPEGVTLSVKDADVSAQLGKFQIPESKKVFGLDISLVKADNTEYQPDGAIVKVPVDETIPVGTMIGIIHKHGDEVATFIGLTEVLSDHTVEFYTDSFSEFAGFTVDFHYNGVDFSIEGKSEILLSDLFTAMGIEEDAYAAQSVVFSDNTLVGVTKQDDGNWLLTSLDAFDTEETLIITFNDDHAIVIDVTDKNGNLWSGQDTTARLSYSEPLLGGQKITFILYSSDYPGQYKTRLASNTFTLYKSAGLNTDASTRGTLSITGKDTAWYYGSAENCTITTNSSDNYTFSIKSGNSDTATVRIEQISYELVRKEEPAVPKHYTITQERYSATPGESQQRTLTVKINGNVDFTTTQAFPNRGNASSQLTIHYIRPQHYYLKDLTTGNEYAGRDQYGHYKANSADVCTYSGNVYTLELWTRYNVVFYPNYDCDLDPVTQPFIWTDSKPLTPNTFTRQHKISFDPANGQAIYDRNAEASTFLGWSRSDEENATLVFPKNKLNEDVTQLTEKPGGTYELYAQWDIGAIVLPSAPDKKTGQHFMGWSDGTTTYQAGQTIYPEENMRLTAQWEADVYKVTLDAQNDPVNNPTTDTQGTAAYWYLYNTTKKVNGETVYYWEDAICTQPLSSYTITKPTKKGHTFAGYYTAVNGGGTQYVSAAGECVNNLYKAVADHSTLYAKWNAKTFTVNYHSNGGSGSMTSDQVVYNTAFKIKDNTFTPPTGKKFVGWSLSATGEAHEGGWSNKVDGTGYSGTWNYDNGEYGIANDTLNLYAIWEDAEYTVTWKNWNGTLLEEDTVTHGGSATYNGSEPSRHDSGGYSYTFNGWDKDTSKVTGNMDVTAQYSQTPISYTATFDYNGGDSGVASSPFTVESALSLPALTRTGYAGVWKVTTAAGNWVDGAEYASEGSVTAGMYGNVTFTAQWTAQYRYVLNFDANGGSGGPADQTRNWCGDTSYTFSWDQNSVPTREGYSFLGWAESSASQTNVTGSGYDSYQITGKQAETVEKTLYAIWKRDTGNLKLTFNGGDTAPAIVNVKGQGLDITVVLTKAETVIKDLPTGMYNITAVSGNASYTASVKTNSNPQINKDQTAVVEITTASKGLNWFTAFHWVKNQFKKN